MFVYIIENPGELKIHTPGVTDFSQIKTVSVAKPDCVLMQSDYPTGLHLEIEQHANKVIVYSNKELTQNHDGSLTAPTE